MKFEVVDNYKLTYNIHVEKRIHPTWKEWQSIPRNLLTVHRDSPIIGQYQYVYRSEKGQISLVELPNYFLDGIDFWEIYQLDGSNLFDDCERFGSQKEAEVRIKELLE